MTQQSRPANAGAGRSRILSILLVVGFFVIVNLPYTYERLPYETLNRAPTVEGVLSDFSFGPDAARRAVTEEPSQVLAGWPQSFLISVDHPSGSATRTWNLRGLLTDVGLAVAVILIVVLFARRRFNPRDDSAASNNVRLSDLLALLVLIAAPLAYWQQLRRHATADRKLATQLQRYGPVTRECLVPSRLVTFLPDAVKPSLARTTNVALTAPDSQQLSQLLASGNIHKLRLMGGDYDLASLRRLPSLPLLVELKIVGRPLDGATVQAISQCQGLEFLNLARTNISADGMARIASLSNLRTLDFRDTPVRLSELKGRFGKLKKNAEVVYFPRPQPGRGDSLTLTAWPQLKLAAVMSPLQPVNGELMTVECSDLPQLRRLYLGDLQRFDVALKDCPALEFCLCIAYQRSDRMPVGSVTPRHLWLRSFRVENCAIYNPVTIYGPDLESLVVNTSQDCAIKLSNRSFGDDGQPIDVPYEQSERIAALIDSLGQSNGPRKLSLVGIPLADVDIGPLGKNSGIESLDISSTQVAAKQLIKLAGMEKLRELIALDNAIGHQQLNAILAAVEQIETLHIASSATRRLRIEDHKNLRKIRQEQYYYPEMDALRLVNLPQFESPMVLNPAARYLYVENVPNLRGLGVMGTFPRDAVLRGTGGLRWFVGGGSNLTSEIFTEILSNTGLEHLTLVEADVPAERFAELARLPRLKKLSLDGCRVNDAAVAAWRDALSIQELNLENTEVGDAAIDVIASMRELTKLQLAGSRVSGTQLNKLANLPNLTDLSLSDTELDADALTALGDIEWLKRVSLQRCNIPDWSAFAELGETRMGSWGRCDLRGIEVDADVIRKIADTNPELRFLLSPEAVDSGLLVVLNQRNQLIIEEEPMGVAFAMNPWMQRSEEPPSEFQPPPLGTDSLKMFMRMRRGAP